MAQDIWSTEYKQDILEQLKTAKDDARYWKTKAQDIMFEQFAAKRKNVIVFAGLNLNARAGLFTVGKKQQEITISGWLDILDRLNAVEGEMIIARLSKMEE